MILLLCERSLIEIFATSYFFFSFYIDSRVHYLPIATSNHAHLLMDIESIIFISKTWIYHLSCNKVVELAWNKPQQGSLSFQLLLRINETKSQLKS